MIKREKQAGRGRAGRRWDAPVCMVSCLYPLPCSENSPAISQESQMAGRAVAPAQPPGHPWLSLAAFLSALPFPAPVPSLGSHCGLSILVEPFCSSPTRPGPGQAASVRLNISKSAVFPLRELTADTAGDSHLSLLANQSACRPGVYPAVCSTGSEFLGRVWIRLLASPGGIPCGSSYTLCH